jgi:hypothetical protein
MLADLYSIFKNSCQFVLVACTFVCLGRKTRPFGFQAKPTERNDGSVDMMLWNCIIPGKEGTNWDGGYDEFSSTTVMTLL